MSTLPQIPPNDPIIAWHRHALEAIQSAGSNGKPGVPPTTGTRLMAMLSTALEASRDSGDASAGVVVVDPAGVTRLVSRKALTQH